MLTMISSARASRALVVASFLVGVAPCGAAAADLSPDVEVDSFQVETPPPMPVFTWTGLTAGLQLGAVLGHDRAGTRGVTGGDTGVGADQRGVIGGAHVGYDQQTSGRFGGQALVFGLEGDVDGAGGRGSAVGGLPRGASVSTVSDIKGSVRARAGVPINRVLLYATGGAAFADFTTRVKATTAGGFDDTANRARAGFTLGGGVDYAFMNDLSLRAEYRYSDYGTFTDQLNLPGPTGGSISHAETDHRVQAAISYRFGSVAPVAAHE